MNPSPPDYIKPWNTSCTTSPSENTFFLNTSNCKITIEIDLLNIPKENRNENGSIVFEMHSQEADASARALSIKAETNTGIPDLNKGVINWWEPSKKKEQIFEGVGFYPVNNDSLLQGQEPLNITWNVGLVQYRSRYEYPFTFNKLKNTNYSFTGIVFKDRVYRYGHFTEDFKFEKLQFTNIYSYSISRFMGIRIIMKETDKLLTVEHDRILSPINLIAELGGTLKFFDVFSKLFLLVAFIIWIVKVLKCDRVYSKLKKVERMLTPIDEDSVEERENENNTVVIDNHSRPSAILMEPLLDNTDAS